MQLGETTWPEDVCDPLLGRSRRVVDRLLEAPTLGSEPDYANPSVGRIGFARQVPVLFKVPEQVVNRLFRDSRPVRKLTWTLSLEARIAPEPDVRRIQIIESCRNHPCVELLTDPLPNNTQLGAHIRASFFAVSIEGGA